MAAVAAPGNTAAPSMFRVYRSLDGSFKSLRLFVRYFHYFDTFLVLRFDRFVSYIFSTFQEKSRCNIEKILISCSILQGQGWYRTKILSTGETDRQKNNPVSPLTESFYISLQKMKKKSHFLLYLLDLTRQKESIIFNDFYAFSSWYPFLSLNPSWTT